MSNVKVRRHNLHCVWRRL